MGFIGAANGVIDHNVIVQNSTGHIFGIGPGLYDTLIDGNTLQCDLAFHDDSVYGRTNCTIINNLFKGCAAVVDWEGNTFGARYRDVIVANNIAEMTNLVGYINAFLYLSSQQTNSGFSVTGNRVKDANPANLNTSMNAFMDVYNCQGIIVNGNIVDAALTNYVGTGNTNVLIHNFDAFGNHGAGNVGTY